METPSRLALLLTLVASVLALPRTSFANHTVVKATADPERFGTPHELTAYGRNRDKDTLLDPGEQTAKRFRRIGTYKYRCRLHSTMTNGRRDGMCGVIHVARY